MSPIYWKEFLERLEVSKCFLYHTICKNFVAEQPHRFSLVAGKPCEEGTMLFCDRYLDAQFLMTLEPGVALYSDDATGEFVVCILTEVL